MTTSVTNEPTNQQTGLITIPPGEVIHVLLTSSYGGAENAGHAKAKQKTSSEAANV